jgi:hypothetical protein
MDQSAEWDDLPEWTPDDDDTFEPVRGHAVRHGSFGTGRVVDVRGEGRDQKLLVQFPEAGLKLVLTRFVEPIA